MPVYKHKSMDPRQISLLLLMLLFSCLMGCLQANQFNVGGRQGWVVNPSEDYNSWSSRMRFQVNDTLLFKYNKGADSVLVVSKDDYDKCNTQNPITKMEDGNSVFKFDRSGPFYFISGNQDNCNKGQKLTVVVMAVRNKAKPSPTPSPPSPPVAPAPSPLPKPPATTPSPPPAPGTTPVSPTPAVSPPGAPPSSPPAAVSPPPGTGPVAPSTPTAPTPSTSPPGSSPANSNSTAPPSPPRSSAPAFMTPSVALISSVTLVVCAFLG